MIVMAASILKTMTGNINHLDNRSRDYHQLQPPRRFGEGAVLLRHLANSSKSDLYEWHTEANQFKIELT